MSFIRTPAKYIEEFLWSMGAATYSHRRRGPDEPGENADQDSISEDRPLLLLHARPTHTYPAEATTETAMLIDGAGEYLPRGLSSSLVNFMKDCNLLDAMVRDAGLWMEELNCCAAEAKAKPNHS